MKNNRVGTAVSRLALLAAMGMGGLDAAVVSLGNDFSITNGNPNGQWSYKVDSTNLTLQTPTANGNTLIPALSTGYWGAGPDLNTTTPEIFKALVNAGSAGGSSTLDFLAGDIVAHSPNTAGSVIYAIWTAPSAGTISSLAGSVWYAHSAVTRSDSYQLLFNSTTLASGTVATAQNRTNASTFASGTFSVSAGDTIALALFKTAGQDFGSLAGLSLTMDFAPAQSQTPEPSTFVMLGTALAGLVALRRRS